MLAIAALRLVDRGVLNLDEPLGGARYNLRQLLRHEAGLPDYGQVFEYHADVAAGKAPWPVERLFTVLDVDRLRYEPGMCWAYSNVGYLKVAQLIERTAGLPLQAALAQLVFQPCNLATARLAMAPADLDNIQMGGVRNYHPGLGLSRPCRWRRRRRRRPAEIVDDGPTAQAGHVYGNVGGTPRFPNRLTPTPVQPMGWASCFGQTTHWTIRLATWARVPGSKLAVLAQNQKVAAVWAGSESSLDAEVHALSLLA